MNFLQLKTEVVAYADDLNFGYFLESQVERWLNHAQVECQKLLLQAGQNFYAKTVSTNLISGQQEYILPIDFVDLQRLSVITSGTGPTATQSMLTKITTNQQDLVTNQSGVPAFYNIIRNRLYLYPIPNGTQVLQLIYSPVVTDMVLPTDVPNVPAEYEEFLVILAVISCLLKDGREMGGFIAKRDYYQQLMKDTATERNVDGPRSIVTTGEWGSGDANWSYW